jgi:hypothetical protein
MDATTSPTIPVSGQKRVASNDPDMDLVVENAKRSRLD